MAREFIISQFGLQALKPAIYGRNLGKEMSTGSVEYIDQSYEPVASMSIEAENPMSYLGTPVFSDLMLSDRGTGTGLYFTTVLFDVSQQKNIIKTSIVGRRGTIKEYIADGDYVINIKGAFVSQDNNYPLDEVTEFIRLMKLPESLDCISRLLQLFEIDEVVVESYSLPQKAGFQNTQLFEINAVSDIPLEFREDDQTIQ